jgi:glycosyltransferase involved in cell wall biosynthesis
VVDGDVTEVTQGDELIVVIPACDEAERIGATVRAARRFGPVVVVDDGSRDATAELAAQAGAAAVVRLPRNRGKGAALEAGIAEAGRRSPAGPPRFFLFLDADLGATAANAAPVVDAVRTGGCAMAVAVPPPQPGGGHGFVVRLAREGVRRLCGFEADVPLSGQRCLTQEAAEAARPFAGRFGVEVGLTVDLVRKGFAVREVPAELRHRVTGKDWRAQLHRARQYRDVRLALFRRRTRRA